MGQSFAERIGPFILLRHYKTGHQPRLIAEGLMKARWAEADY